MSHVLQTMIHQLGRTVAREGLAKLGDAELLRRFTTDCDSLAFEAIIWRHGTMVFGVCRRVLGRGGEAEDAFQATFLSLIRHARSVRAGESLAGWLYRVARRLSVRTSRQRDRQVKRESQTARPEAQIVDEIERTDWHQHLDREIERLPARYREAFILCHLEDRDHKDAARELGCPLGTLHSRLARAKERLRAQLGLNGLAFPAVATALVSPRLVNATIAAANEFAKGSFPAMSTSAVAISNGGYKLMGFINAKCLAMTFLAVTTIGSGAVLLNQPTATATSSTVRTASAEPTIEELKRENQQLRQEVARLKKRITELEGERSVQEQEPPTDSEVLRALHISAKDKKESQAPLTERYLSDITIVKNRIIVQNAKNQDHSVCWECVVYYTEELVTKNEDNTENRKKTHRVDTVYINKNDAPLGKDLQK